MVITLRRVLIACGVLVALAAGVVVLAHILRPGVVASTKGQSILSRALLATEKEPFEAGAVVVTSYGGRTLRSTAHIVHAANGTVTTEYLDGPIAGTKVVSNGSGMTWLGPNLAKATYQATPSIDAAERLRLIGSSYSPTCLGSDTVAGRDCYVIEIHTGKLPCSRSGRRQECRGQCPSYEGVRAA
jgi:negative regulator of sigma E activity